MINKETILSNYNDRLTLLQWLKKVELALQNASAKEFRVNQLGNATLTFSIVFDDDTELTTGPIVLQQGESVASASITNGHLLLTLTNGDVLDAGDVGAVTGFSIDGSQHLIVTYQDGTTQDLGAIFNGDVVVNTLTQTNPNESATLTLISNITGIDVAEVYNRLEVINNILWLVCNVSLTNNSGSDIAINAGSVVFVNEDPTLSNDTKAKIFDMDGNAVSSYVSTRSLITQFEGYLSASKSATQGSAKKAVCKLMHFHSTTQLWASMLEAHTIPAGETHYFTSRTALTLI